MLQACLAKLLLFNNLESTVQRKTVMEMYERQVLAGEILIKEGDTGLAASELYVVKSGQFEVCLQCAVFANAFPLSPFLKMGRVSI
jgi:CRP-like cAMP-binding protein